MQRPHDTVLERNPSFAELLPKLEARFQAYTKNCENEVIKGRLDEVIQRWTRLQILWDEMQLLMLDERNGDVINYAHTESRLTRKFARSLDLHIAQSWREQSFDNELNAIRIPKSHTFLPDTQSVKNRWEILSDMLAATLNEKLSIFKKLETLGPTSDLMMIKETRDAELEEYDSANTELLDRINLLTMELYKESAETLNNLTHFLENVKHGAVDRFTESYLAYHEVASFALLEKVERALSSSIDIIYTPELRSALDQHSRQVRKSLPQVQERLRVVDAEIHRYESARTPDYVIAAEQYQRLKAAVQQAEDDVNKLIHYKSEK